MRFFKKRVWCFKTCLRFCETLSRRIWEVVKIFKTFPNSITISYNSLRRFQSLFRRFKTFSFVNYSRIYFNYRTFFSHGGAIDPVALPMLSTQEKRRSRHHQGRRYESMSRGKEHTPPPISRVGKFWIFPQQSENQLTCYNACIINKLRWRGNNLFDHLRN